MSSVTGFDFSLATRILFGLGEVKNVGIELSKLGANRVLIISDEGVIKAGIIQPILSSIKELSLPTSIFSDVKSNPISDNVDQAASLIKSDACNVIVAVGGGSSLDTAKAASIVATNGGKTNDYDGWVEPKTDPLPIIAIPTTAGTGSEVSNWAVISDPKSHRKSAIGGFKMAPRLAILDPELTFSLPSSLTAYTGLDALTHAIEAYTSRLANPLSDGLALSAISMIGNSLLSAYQSPRDEKARSNMLVASSMAAIAFNMADLGAVHSVGEAIGGEYNLHHGLACGSALPAVVAFNMPAAPQKYADVAHALGRQDGDAYTAVKQITKVLNIPSLKEIGIIQEDIPRLAKAAFDNIATPNNARTVSVEDFSNLLSGME